MVNVQSFVAAATVEVDLSIWDEFRCVYIQHSIQERH